VHFNEFKIVQMHAVLIDVSRSEIRRNTVNKVQERLLVNIRK